MLLDMPLELELVCETIRTADAALNSGGNIKTDFKMWLATAIVIRTVSEGVRVEIGKNQEFIVRAKTQPKTEGYTIEILHIKAPKGAAGTTNITFPSLVTAGHRIADTIRQAYLREANPEAAEKVEEEPKKSKKQLLEKIHRVLRMLDDECFRAMTRFIMKYLVTKMDIPIERRDQVSKLIQEAFVIERSLALAEERKKKELEKAREEKPKKVVTSATSPVSSTKSETKPKPMSVLMAASPWSGKSQLEKLRDTANDKRKAEAAKSSTKTVVVADKKDVESVLALAEERKKKKELGILLPAELIPENELVIASNEGYEGEFIAIPVGFVAPTAEDWANLPDPLLRAANVSFDAGIFEGETIRDPVDGDDDEILQDILANRY